MTIPPDQRIDALRMKEECQARVRQELAGLSPEERERKAREMVETGPFAELWKRLREAKTHSSVGG